MEVGQAIPALDVVDAQLDLAERLFLILVQIAEGELDDTALKRIVCVLYGRWRRRLNDRTAVKT